MVHVFYHDHCCDGFAAAYAAWRGLNTAARYVPVSYNQPVPDGIGPEDTVYILDFSYPRAELEKLGARVAKLVVLDHHATAEKDLAGLPNCYFTPDKSGCVMAWEFFNPDLDVPWVFNWIQQRDLGWPWNAEKASQCEPSIHTLYAGLWHGFDRTFQEWDRYDIVNLTKGGVLLRAGWIIEASRDILIKDLLPNAHWLLIEGHVVPALNACCYQSELGHALLQRFSFAPFSVVWMAAPNPQLAKLSLRSIEGRGVDCGTICRRTWGKHGGGHALAAGATVAMMELVSRFSAPPAASLTQEKGSGE